ncbi:MAG TPA: sigma-70 family RNA polymerase sigma factor [Candidatus Ruminococcus avistercoris]|nr:sigma-70 family RNA polymerase sigma factor [Candidatus Ruminococcus avistercoris]
MQKLIKKALAGDKDAFVALIEKNKLQMYKIARCYLISEEDIGDALQETILSCYKNLHTLKKPAFFKTWMIRILINQCKDILRGNQSNLVIHK